MCHQTVLGPPPMSSKWSFPAHEGRPARRRTTAAPPAAGTEAHRWRYGGRWQTGACPWGGRLQGPMSATGGVSAAQQRAHTQTRLHSPPHDPCVTPYPGPPGYCLSLGSIHRSASSTYVFFSRLVLGLPATHGGQTEETHKNEPVHILFVDLSLVGAPTWLVACAHL